MHPLRFPRFSRACAVAPMQLTNRDREIIRLVHRYRFLHSPQIVSFIGDPAQSILRRLQLLYHHGYLERPRAQLVYYQHGGSRPIVYGLGTKGAACLPANGATAGEVRWSEKNRSVERFFLEHALLVSDVMVAIELACRQTGVRLITEEELLLSNAAGPKDQSFKWYVNITSRQRLGVIPDRVFALEFTGKSGNPERAYFFLEADRGTMPVIRHSLTQTSFYRKLLAYEATWSQSIHQKRFGFHRFRVLTVTTSAKRVESLVNACSQLKRGQGLFLFADRSVLEKPTEILSAIWQTGRPGQTGRLLD